MADISLLFDVAMGKGNPAGDSESLIRAQLEGIVNSINEKPLSIKFQADTNSLAEIQNQIKTIKETLGSGIAFSVNTSSSTNSSGDISKLVQDNNTVNNQLKERINLEKQVKKATASAGETAEESEIKRQSLLKKSYTLLTQMQKTTDWTASKTGKTATEYAAIQGDISDLQKYISEFNQGTITTDDFSEKLSHLSSNFASNTNIIKNASEATKSWAQRLGNLSEKFGTWFSITRVIMAAYRTVKQMISAVIELDTAMTELKKVTDETDAAYDKFLDNATKRAKELGSALSDVVTATADFARLGFNIEDAESLADAAIIYKNVGDGISDINEASESIIATMQAFGVEAKDVMTIVDKYNEVGNNYAISSKGVGDALLRSAAAMNAANNTLDETIALAAASNTIVQDPEKVGTTLKTVSMYLRAAKTEAEDAGESTDGMANSVSELREEILALTGNQVDIQLDENTFKSTYQILKELSEVWSDLSDISQANILEMVGGKRNSNVVAAILENFTIAEEALKTSAESSGSALAENEKVLDSINGKLNIFKAHFEEFANNLISSDLVKDIVDLGTGLMKILNDVTKLIDVLGGLENILFTIVGVIATIKIDSILTSLSGKFNSLGTTIVNFTNAFITARTAGHSALKSISAGFQTVASSASVAQIAVGSFVAIISILSIINQAMEEARQKAISVAEAERESAAALVEKSDALNSAYLEYLKYSEIAERTPSQEEAFQNSLKSVTEALEGKTKALNGLAAGTKAYTDALGEQIEKELEAAKIAAMQERDAAEKALEKTSYNAWGQSEIRAYFGGTGTDNAKEKELIESLLGDYIKTQTYAGMGVSASDYYLDAQSKEAEDIVEYYYKLLYLKDELTRQNMMEGESYDNVTSSINTLKPVVEAYVKAKYDEVATIYKVTNGIPKSIEEYEKYKKHISSNLSKSFGIYNDETINSLVEGYLETENLYKSLKKVDEVASDATSSVKTFAEAISSVEKLSDGFDKLDKIYADIYNKEDFDWGSILNNEEFAKTFGDLGEDYDNFIKTVANSSSDIDACQAAFDNLATSYIRNSDIIKDVTTETRDATVAMLEQMGVANAASIVDAKLAYDKEKLTYTTGEYANKTYEEIFALYKECEAGSVTQQVLAELAVAKMLANDNYIKSDSDIDQLIALAKAANATTASIERLAQAKALMTELTAESTRVQSLIKSENITDPRGLSSVRWKERLIQSQINELLNDPLEYDTLDADKFKVNYSGGSATKSAKDAAAKAKSKEETWFEKQLAKHKHLVAMEKETQEEYLAWLNDAYPKAYKEGIIELNDFYKYQEEVFEGLRDIFRDNLGDIEHEISMRENYDGEEKKIIALYKGLIKDVEKEIAKARKQGLTDEDEYIQELQGKWQDYTNAIKDIREEIKESAKDALDELVDYRIDMLKQEIEDEKEALDKKLDNLKEFYDKQKEMLQDKYDEEKYLEEQAEKRKSVSDIKSELAMLENDNSAWAQKRKLELQEELSVAEKDLSSFEKDNALDKALDALDDAYNSQEAQLQKEMDALDEKLNDPNALFNKALEDIKNNSKNQLYYQMLMYNRQYGDGNDETVKQMWEEAYGALNDYEKLFGKLYKGVDLKNETGVKEEKGWDDKKVSGANPNNKPSTTTSKPSSSTKTQNDKNKSPSLSKGSTITVKKTATNFSSKSKGVKMASFVPGGSYTVYQTDGDQVLIGRDGVYTGWIKKSDIVGYASGTKNATAGLHELYEQGAETLFVSSSGGKYRILNDGDKVFSAKATDFLYDFANSEGKVLTQMLKNVLGSSLFDNIIPPITNNEINMGDINVHGNADMKTVSEIRRAQRESVDFMLKELTKLNK